MDTIKKRENIEEKYTWNLAHIFETDNAWQTEYEAIENCLAKFDEFKDNLANEETLFTCLDANSDITMRASKIYVYANQKLHENMADTTAQGMSGRADNLMLKLNLATSFITPEILSLSNDKLN